MVKVSVSNSVKLEPLSYQEINGSAGDVGVSLYKTTYLNGPIEPPLAVKTTSAVGTSE